MDVSVNRNSVDIAKLKGVQGIKEVDPRLQIDEAMQKTQDNGIDELYFKIGDKKYVAYGESIDFKPLQKGIPAVSFDNKKVDAFFPSDENNSVFDGAKTGAVEGFKRTRDIVSSAVNVSMKSVGVSGVVVAGGAITVAGIAVAKGAAISSASAMTSIVSDVLKTGSRTALKGIALAVAGGLSMEVGTGIITGISDAKSKQKNYQTIASVTKDGVYKTPDPKPEETPPADNKPADGNK